MPRTNVHYHNVKLRDNVRLGYVSIITFLVVMFITNLKHFNLKFDDKNIT